MNYLKLLVIIFLPFAIIGCNDDNEFNTGEATVEFQTAETQTKELTSLFSLPITVKGEHNGLIKAHIAIQENNSGFENDKGILITEENLLIPAGTDKIDIEILLSVANDDIVRGRSFSIAIISVEGATVGTNNVCKINLQENSPIEGKYIMEGKSQLQSPTGVVNYHCTLTAVDESFQQMYLDFGQGDKALADVEATNTEGEFKLTIAADQSLGTYSGNNVKLTHKIISGGRWVVTDTPIAGIFKNKVVAFEMGHALGMEVPATQGWLGLVASYTDDTGNAIPVKLIKQ